MAAKLETGTISRSVLRLADVLKDGAFGGGGLHLYDPAGAEILGGSGLGLAEWAPRAQREEAVGATLSAAGINLGPATTNLGGFRAAFAPMPSYYLARLPDATHHDVEPRLFSATSQQDSDVPLPNPPLMLGRRAAVMPRPTPFVATVNPTPNLSAGEREQGAQVSVLEDTVGSATSSQQAHHHHLLCRAYGQPGHGDAPVAGLRRTGTQVRYGAFPHQRRARGRVGELRFLHRRRFVNLFSILLRPRSWQKSSGNDGRIGVTRQIKLFSGLRPDPLLCYNPVCQKERYS